MYVLLRTVSVHIQASTSNHLTLPPFPTPPQGPKYEKRIERVTVTKKGSKESQGGKLHAQRERIVKRAAQEFKVRVDMWIYMCVGVNKKNKKKKYIYIYTRVCVSVCVRVGRWVCVCVGGGGILFMCVCVCLMCVWRYMCVFLYLLQPSKPWSEAGGRSNRRSSMARREKI